MNLYEHHSTTCIIVLLKLLQADDAHKNDDQAHSDVPTVAVPSNDDHTSDNANQNPNDPAVCTYE